MWLDVPNSVLVLMRDGGMNAAEAIHAAQHAFLNRFTLAADLRTECKVPEKEYKATESQRKRPARRGLFFHQSRSVQLTVSMADSSSMNPQVNAVVSRPKLLIMVCSIMLTVRICLPIFPAVNDILLEAHDRVESCQCEEGCAYCM